MDENKTVREILENGGCDLEAMEEENVLTFDGPDYREAIIGVTYDNRHVVYDYELMLQHLQKKDGMTLEEAVEFIDYNASANLSGYNMPVILCRFD